MKIRECMCDKVVFVKPDSSVKQTAKIMSDNHIGFLPVCDDSKNIVGIVTDRDIILRTIACDKDTNSTPISDIMSTDVYVVTPDDEIETASQMMCKSNVRRLPVIENNQIVGVITIGDLARNNKVNTNEVGKTVEGICSRSNENAE